MILSGKASIQNQLLYITLPLVLIPDPQFTLIKVIPNDFICSSKHVRIFIHPNIHCIYYIYIMYLFKHSSESV